jgi:hypothetical protein
VTPLPQPDETPAGTGAAGAAGAAWRPSIIFLAVAAGLVAGVLAAGWIWISPRTPPGVVADGRPSGVASAKAGGPTLVATLASPSKPAANGPLVPPSDGGPPPRDVRRLSRQRDPGGDQSPDLSDFVNDGDIPTGAEAIDRLHRAGIHGGLGAFTPPGTRPPLIGLAVPEDFDLPAGYVRHFQVTDDGQRIEPILMFSPGIRFVDVAGQQVAIPADRVVPPEMAPPGLPIRRIAVPSPIDPAWRGR